MPSGPFSSKRGLATARVPEAGAAEAGAAEAGAAEAGRLDTSSRKDDAARATVPTTSGAMTFPERRMAPDVTTKSLVVVRAAPDVV